MQLSPEYITQFFQRIGEKTPKFFKILAIFFAGIGALLLGANYYSDQLTAQHLPIPAWLPYVIIILKGIMYASGIITAKLTIQTASTPPLASEIAKPTLEDAMKEIAELKAREQSRVLLSGAAMAIKTDQAPRTDIP